MHRMNRMWAAGAAGVCGAGALAAPPGEIELSYQGYLQQAGEVYEEGTAELGFLLFDAAEGGSFYAVSDGYTVDVDPRTGHFSVDFTLDVFTDMQTGEPFDVFNGEDRWLQIFANGEMLSPRTKIQTPPVARDVAAVNKAWRRDGDFVTLAHPARVGIGTSNPAFALDVNGSTRVLSLEAQSLGGDSLYVDIASAGILEIRGGSDIAEPFDIDGDPLPGMVVSIDPHRVGKMRIADSAYDTRVAGIISGAGGVNPGLTLTQEGSVADGEHPVALSGRVWCYVDADAGGPVEAGDLLTSSPTPGHAMKATDTGRAHGAVIGKAMSSLDEGRGLVLVLVNLQ
jgi:hypothetical protein